MNLRNLFRFRYYRKLVCSFVLIGVLLVSMAVVCISIMFSRMTVKRVGEMSVSSVRQVADSLDTLLENCQNAADILMNERYFTSVAGSYTLDRLKEYALMSSIMKLKINYPYIRHMGIVNGRLDRYVGTRGVYFGCEDSIKEADLSQENQHYAIFARNVREYENTEESKKISVLTYLYEPYSFRGTGSYIVMDLDLAAMRDQLKLIDSEVWEQIALLNGEGKQVLGVHTGTDQKQALEALAGEIPEGGESGYFSGAYAGTKQLVSFCRLSGIPWCIVGIQPWGNIVSVFMGTQWIFLIGAGLVIVLYVILSVFFSNYIYSPIKDIRDSIGVEPEKDGNQDELELIGNAFSSYRRREDCYRWDTSPVRKAVRKCFKRQDSSWEELDKLSDPFLETMASGSPYCVVVLSADSSCRQNDFYQDRQLYCYILMKMAEELLEESGILSLGLSVSEPEEVEFAVICQTGKEEIPAKMQMGLEEIQLGLHREFHLSVSIGVSSVRRGLEALPSGFHGAVEALEQRILDGPMHLYFEGKLPSRTSLEEYPAALERRLQDRIFAGDGEQARLLSEEFFDSLKNSPPEQALLYFHRLYFSTLSKGISILDSTDISLERQERLWQAAHVTRDLAGMKQAYLALCAELTEQIGRVTFRSSTEQAVNEVKLYMEQNYADPAISLTTLAERVGLSPSYLGQVFSRQLGVSCVDYLAKIRMEEAARKLTETNLTVQQVSESIGILNTSYFYTLFKKAYGMTPHRYRTKKI